jgi:PhnB protein
MKGNKMATKPVPDGYHTVTPYLVVDGAADAIEFYKTAFDATETMRLPMPNGKIGHAEIKIGDSPIMLADECPEMEFRSPLSLGGSATSICLYVEGVDERFNQAVDAGAQVVRPVADQFYGDRTGTLKDPFGHVWTLATHQEDLSPEDLQARFKESMQPS